MSRLELREASPWQKEMSVLCSQMQRRADTMSPAECPVEISKSFLNICRAQSCGKCVPCREGLRQLENIMNQMLDGRGGTASLTLLELTARGIAASADCAIGIEAAKQVLDGLKAFRSDYEAHIKTGHCFPLNAESVPCVAACPAHVDIPGYVALVGEERYEDAVRLIRRDNPFTSVCAYICEHPCEGHCRRALVDSAVNIRGIKLVASENAGKVSAPKVAEKTGKRVAVVGGGPAGLTAAYYLSLMGHSVTVLERREKLGGMLRYGIPRYRLPQESLERDIDTILSLGVEVKTNTNIADAKAINALREEYDAVYCTIGAHADKCLGIAGENAEGVISAVKMLRGMETNEQPELRGKCVVVVGGGNVAMDCARTAVRLGAAQVLCAYRRRKADMTALPREVEEALAEGVELLTLVAPVKMDISSEGFVTGLVVQPQSVGQEDENGRPTPINANVPQRVIPADTIVVAIGQDIECKPFEDAGFTARRGRIQTLADGSVPQIAGVFAGGDCVFGPATVIKAIAAGKTAAANIDEYLGFDHRIECEVEQPAAKMADVLPWGRAEVPQRQACERRGDFACVESCISSDDAMLEARRCLRCDHYGAGGLHGGKREW